MFRRARPSRKILLALMTIVGATLVLFGQSFRAKPAPVSSADLSAKLAQQAAFIPQPEPLSSQLIEVAQRYQLPMGIEVRAMSGDAPAPQLRAAATVRELLDAIISQAPDLQLTVGNGLIHVTSSVAAADSHNVLNLHLDKYCVANQNLFQAEQALRLKVEMELHPADYAEGFVSSYGYPHGHVFTRKKLTLCRTNLTVREALDELAAANGNALWLVEHSEAQAAPAKNSAPAGQPEATQGPRLKPWRFVPLSSAASD